MCRQYKTHPLPTLLRRDRSRFGTEHRKTAPPQRGQNIKIRIRRVEGVIVCGPLVAGCWDVDTLASWQPAMRGPTQLRSRRKDSAERHKKVHNFY